MPAPRNQNPELRASPAGEVSVQVTDGLVSIDVVDADLGEVLKELSRKAGFNVEADENLKEKITLKIVRLPLEETLKKLCENRAILYQYTPQTSTYRIVRAWALSSRKDADTPREVSEAGSANSAPASGSVSAGGRANEAKTLGPGGQEERLYDSRGRLFYKPGELLVKFKAGASEKEIEDLHKSLGSTVMGRMDGARLQKVKLRDGLSETEAIKLYSASPIVQTVERHALRYPDVTPNDPYFADQWGLAKIHSPQAWEIAQGSQEVIVAVIDTGVDYSHPDLSQNIWTKDAEVKGVEGVDDDKDGFVDDSCGWDFGDQDAEPMDVDGHGTHVAGIIAALANNGQGIAGICWRAKILVLKVQADGASEMESWAIVGAVRYAIDRGVRLVNCSFGGEAYSQIEQSAFADLRTAGALVICAAGNDGINTDVTPNYPSGYDLDNIVSVTASDQNDGLASFSNFGSATVDVMAPGVSIKSTTPVTADTDAYVDAVVGSKTTRYQALGMLFAGVTGQAGVTATAYACALGYPQDFPSEVAGKIALIRRGELYFSEKTRNAQNTGAVGVIIYNNVVDDLDQNGGTLGSPGNWIPAVSISKADGEALQALGTPMVKLVNSPAVDPLAYGVKSGTSMAAPFVTGIAGLILSKTPSLGYTAARSALLATVDKVPAVAGKISSGGRVNALAALCSTLGLAGDLSFDNKIGLEDAIVALQIASSLGSNIPVCPVFLAPTMDVDGNGTIGLQEAIYVLRKVAGLGN